MVPWAFDYLVEKGTQTLREEICILDEADEMLRMGFIDDVETILNLLHDERAIGRSQQHYLVKFQILSRKLQNMKLLELKQK